METRLLRVKMNIRSRKNLNLATEQINLVTKKLKEQINMLADTYPHTHKEIKHHCTALF